MTSVEFKEEVLHWAKEVGVEPKEIHLRKMKRKWASCSSKGRLSFNTELLEEPERKRSEVILHELLHLRYPKHGKMFNEMLKVYLDKSGEKKTTGF